MTLGKLKQLERKEWETIKEKYYQDFQKEFIERISETDIEFLGFKEGDECIYVRYAFVLDGYRQEDSWFWGYDKNQEQVINGIKKHIAYIEKLREEYPKYCKLNDYMQTVREFEKTIKLTHMGYERNYKLILELSDYLKLPNSRKTSSGGGDYEIKRTPQRVKEFNENIDITIMALIESITELKQLKIEED